MNLTIDKFHYCDGMSDLNREIGRLQAIIDHLSKDNQNLKTRLAIIRRDLPNYYASVEDQVDAHHG